MLSVRSAALSAPSRVGYDHARAMAAVPIKKHAFSNPPIKSMLFLARTIGFDPDQQLGFESFAGFLVRLTWLALALNPLKIGGYAITRMPWRVRNWVARGCR